MYRSKTVKQVFMVLVMVLSTMGSAFSQDSGIVEPADPASTVGGQNSKAIPVEIINTDAESN